MAAYDRLCFRENQLSSPGCFGVQRTMNSFFVLLNVYSDSAEVTPHTHIYRSQLSDLLSLRLVKGRRRRPPAELKPSSTEIPRCYRTEASRHASYLCWLTVDFNNDLLVSSGGFYGLKENVTSCDTMLD